MTASKSAAQSNQPATLKSKVLYLPLLLAIVGLFFGGIFLLKRADQQARDTVRKHHLEDIEQSLYFARGTHGTFPPYDQPSWCGTLNLPKNAEVQSQIEEVLRQQNDKYANPAKPFPADPVHGQQPKDYFYWKRSPAIFELYSVLEEDVTGERNTLKCKNAQAQNYDYGITSVLREDISL